MDELPQHGVFCLRRLRGRAPEQFGCQLFHAPVGYRRTTRNRHFFADFSGLTLFAPPRIIATNHGNRNVSGLASGIPVHEILFRVGLFPDHELRMTPIRNVNVRNVTCVCAEHLLHLEAEKGSPATVVRVENVRPGFARKQALVVDNVTDLNIERSRVR